MKVGEAKVTCCNIGSLSEEAEVVEWSEQQALALASALQVSRLLLLLLLLFATSYTSSYFSYAPPPR